MGPDAEAVYDQIAEAWAKSRSGPWPEVTRFVASLPRGARLLDVGAGSGRYLKIRETAGLQALAVDVSRAQLKIASREAPDARLIRGDLRALPLRAGTADGALVVAVVHHLETREERVAALREVRRVLAPGGNALVSAWSRDSDTFEGARAAPRGGPADFLVPFKAGQAVPVDRFFHAYGQGELAAEAKEAGFGGVREWAARENWFVEARA